ncbi:MAG: hypothetical protein UT66_C0001G0018 [candidate division CPR2 bacterium GW2011_GWC1_39_9]|uniref:Uncharacterized protein n=1 Tax=candidate division CPR2 bacterium GW2011_GWC2_39_10 TaxID=1618345 RepID=A0A0G0LU07_UNCC2|nr:MAG: hypothetical protein UT18_C0001G0020 [candidate division CPR2 bacterium GW2011_GWC2_39_10]KKR36194.1 MAG: hypothetical protein UT66_C0001G0018 [candidate division CPR2 bacterium GW2011_GWC1_39_9]
MDETTNTNSVGADKEALKQAIKSAANIDELKESIQKAMDSGFTNDSEFIEIAKSKHQELTSMAAEESAANTNEVKPADNVIEPVTETTPIDEASAIDTSSIDSESEPEVETSTEDAAVESAVAPIEEPTAVTPDDVTSSEPLNSSDSENNTDDIAELVASRDSSNNNSENTLPDNNDESIGNPDINEEATNLPVEDAAPATPAVEEENTETAEAEPASTLAEAENAEPSAPEAEPEKKKEELKDIILEELKKQFNEAMGDLVVLAADASDLTEDQKKEAGLLGEKAKYAWSKIVEKRPANENMHIDDQNKYITDIVEEQLKKVGS